LPIFRLTEKLVFPPVELADSMGRLAIGGDLSSERLLLAYSEGIFPWYGKGQPVIWWSPDPRLVIFPSDIHISKSMRRVINKRDFDISFDKCFRDVITECAGKREGQNFGTWIMPEMIDAYCKLNEIGYAHSVEVWKDNKLVGGLYGVSIGTCFFGESMFSRESNASKFALIKLAKKLEELSFSVIDCQVYTPLMVSLGAVEIPRYEFISVLKEGTKKPSLKGNWGELLKTG